jgi:hypothetical protein
MLAWPPLVVSTVLMTVFDPAASLLLMVVAILLALVGSTSLPAVLAVEHVHGVLVLVGPPVPEQVLVRIHLVRKRTPLLMMMMAMMMTMTMVVSARCWENISSQLEGRTSLSSSSSSSNLSKLDTSSG